MYIYIYVLRCTSHMFYAQVRKNDMSGSSSCPLARRYRLLARGSDHQHAPEHCAAAGCDNVPCGHGGLLRCWHHVLGQFGVTPFVASVKSTWPRLGSLWKVSPWWFLWWIFASIVPFVLSVAVRFFQLQNSSSQDLATPVNLPLAVSFTDTDPTAGSYGGVVTWAARRVGRHKSCFEWSEP